MKKKTLRTAQEEDNGYCAGNFIQYSLVYHIDPADGSGGGGRPFKYRRHRLSAVCRGRTASDLIRLFRKYEKRCITENSEADNRTWTQRKRTYCQCNSKDGNAPVIKGQDAHAHTLFSQC